ncbi:MAG: hypothetical protein AAGE52_20765 [Myxococcota bacterium]
MTENPFQATADPRRIRKLVGGGLTAAVLLVGGVLVATMEGPKTFVPEGVAASLRTTDWALPARADGYRSLGSALDANARASLVALGEDGAVAVALRGERAVVIVWRAGQWQRHAIPETRAVTALAIDPEGRVHVGMQDGRLARIDPDGTVAADPAMVAGQNSVISFAFDRESPKSAVMVAGGELHTALRPFEAGALNVVTMPAARTRVAAYDHAGTLVVAGDAGAAYGSTSSGWEERSLASSGRAVALGHDGHGLLLLAQDNGYVFREDGHRWELVGRVGRTPVAVGELPDQGIVVLAADGSFWAMLDRDDFSEMEALTTTPVTAALVQGHNVLAVSEGDLYARAGDASWSSAAIEGPRLGCTPLTFDAPVVPPLVRCEEELYEVGPEGLAEAEDPEGWNLAWLSTGTRRDGAQLWTWVGETLWQARANGALRFASRSELRHLGRGATEWSSVAILEAPIGPIRSLDAVGSNVWVAARSGSIYRVDTSAESPELEEAAAHESIEELTRTPREPEPERAGVLSALSEGLAQGFPDIVDPVDDIDVVAHRQGALVVHHRNLGALRGVFLSEAGLTPLALPPVAVFFHRGEGTFTLTPEGLREVTPTGLTPVALEGLPPDVVAGVRAGTIVRSVGDVFAFRVGERLVYCKANACRVVDVGPIVSFAPNEAGDVVVREVGGRMGYLRWTES